MRVVEAGLVGPQRRRASGSRPRAASAHTTWARVAPGGELEAAVERAYERFLPLNRELLRVCSDWQVRPGGVPNDHRDPTYDWSVIDRLVTLDDRVGPIAAHASAARVDRFARLPAAAARARVERVDDGEHEWLTSPRIDSYHTVWMQLHEDLLLALGRDRASEE